MSQQAPTNVLEAWPDESREATKLVIDKYGDPDEVAQSFLVWHRAGPWKRIVATQNFVEHQFPAPHIDAIECVIDYHVPPERASEIAQFDGSVIVERTAGEVSARCHDEEANKLALNLMHDIVTGAKSVTEARDYYAEEFLNARRNGPTPYMDELRFEPEVTAKDSDSRVLSDEQLEAAQRQGSK